MMYGLPVRVIRGYRHTSPYSPTDGYCYDGLYRVEDYWRERGRSGYLVWRFRLTKLDQTDQPSYDEEESTPDAAPTATERQASTVLRIVRDTAQAQRVKELYDYHCQICGVLLKGAAGPYAEADHIRPLGRPHNGPDTTNNVLCLCPNHHVLFDLGSVVVQDDLSLQGEEGSLAVHPEHQISREQLRYHREDYGQFDKAE